MNKLFSAGIALALTAALLTGCRGNVSDHENGRITDPTMMPETIATIPSTDTTPPMTTQPTQDTARPDMDRPTETHGGNSDAGTPGSEGGIGGGAGSTEGSGAGGGTGGGSGSSSGSAGTNAKVRPNRSMG